MAGVESLAMGVPVLAADNRGTREYMEQGVNGFLCPWDDPEAFAAGMAALRELGPRSGRTWPGGAWTPPGPSTRSTPPR